MNTTDSAVRIVHLPTGKTSQNTRRKQLRFHVISHQACFDVCFHGYTNRYHSGVSADSLSAAEQRQSHAYAEGPALPEHDG